MKKETGKTKKSFEDMLARIEEIALRLEQENVPLEDALKLFEEGMTLHKAAQERIDQAELKIKKVIGKDAQGNPILEGLEEE